MTAQVRASTDPAPAPTPTSASVGAGVGMPGRRFGLAIAALIALELYSVSLPGYASWHLFLLGGWFVAGLTWLLWLVVSAIASPRRTVSAVWRWGVIAVAVSATFLVVDSGAPLRLRFDLSRPAFDALAAELSAPGSSDRIGDRKSVV